MKRQRSRNRKPAGNSNNPNRAYESNGPEGTKVRGNAQTIYEKYQQLARDANSSGDRVLAENHLQHAEHYFRMIRQMQPTRPVSEFVQRDPFSNGFDDYDDEFDGENAEQEETATTEESSSGYDEQPRFENRDRNDRQNRDNQNRDNNGNRNDRQNRDNNGNRDRNFKDRGDRDFRNDRQNRDNQNRDNGEQRSFEPRNTNAPRDNAPRDNGPRDEPQFDENGNRRETRRERYERRRQQRFAEQEQNLNAPVPVAGAEQPYVAPAFIASTQPLGAAPRTPQPDLGFEAPVSEAPVVKTRAPRKERAAAEDASHLPAFLSRPTPVAAEAAPAEDTAKPKRAPRKRKEDAPAEDA